MNISSHIINTPPEPTEQVVADLQKDRPQLADKLDQLRATQARWERRAKQVANYNQGKALECIKRRNECSAQVRFITQALETEAVE